ncbi:HAD family hydrolase [Prevotella sp. MGM1]|uniref:HAD family hydrolase n=1 Tax=Prevotella sp. MGM1 TaxID=2033405 RepID=UPI000D0C4165|nr:HAD family hydrolase [Prevotella sp. MGM1]GAY27070.1 HAD family hydrolase [Prevotella sp. MGM1]
MDNMFSDGIEVIVFDADDTLWDCQSHFEKVERRYCELLSSYGDEKTVAGELFRTERENMAMLGYGTKAFTLSLIENAVRVSGGKVSGDMVGEIVSMGKSLLSMPAVPLPGVYDALARLSGYRMAVFTKGELLDQENKLRRSGLAGFFEHVEIVSDKTEREHAALCDRLGVVSRRVLMVGNSFRSDIAPAVAIGARAVHIPFHVTWELEKTEEYAHERIVRLSHISELPSLVLSGR